MDAHEIVTLMFLGALLLSLGLSVIYVNLIGRVPYQLLALLSLSSVFFTAQSGVTYR